MLLSGRRDLIVAGVLAALALAVAVPAARYMTHLQFSQLAERGQNTLGLAVSALRGELARYRALPALIAQYDTIHALVQDPGDPALVAGVNAQLKEINALLGSSDIYVLLPDGLTVAASNHDGPASFVGESFAYRPYFYDAAEGREGRFFALGTTSLKRGYYFGAPVWVGDRILGVVVFKVDVDQIERTWHGADFRILVTDRDGIIFMSDRPEWRYAAIDRLTPERLERSAATRRYADTELRELPVTRAQGPTGHLMLTVEEGGARTEYLAVTENMAEADWTVKVLMQTRPARFQALVAITALLLLLGVAVLGWHSLQQRRRRMEERLAVQRDAQEMLERRVSERTADLAEVNRRLNEEVVERRATERQLRRTQSDLVQAGKLAALGQMSAALSHEFNQPLGAVRAYAENAEILLERGRIDDARGNIADISLLADRMAELGRHLRNFARKPNARLQTVTVAEVLRDTRPIVAARLREARVELQTDLGPDPIHVRVGTVRLQQVLVNILTNAADAVESLPDPRIALTARQDGARVFIIIRDNGPGVPQAIAARIFDPFFTTKGVGRGLGLGLSISYNIIKDFDGELRVGEAEGRGAEFVIELPAADGDPGDGPGDGGAEGRQGGRA